MHLIFEPLETNASIKLVMKKLWSLYFMNGFGKAYCSRDCIAQYGLLGVHVAMFPPDML